MKKHGSKLAQWQKDAKNHQCSCGRQAETVDHIIPVQMLRLFLQEDAIWDDESNWQYMCRTCNQIKANQLDYRNPKTVPLLGKYLRDLERKTAPIVNKITNRLYE
jgi:5-methylcytosine-specific restriction endonuclease McrA